jgi:acyl carrier protein
MTRQTITKKVTDVISATMGINLPDIDKTMSELGVDIIDLFDIRIGLEIEFKKNLPDGIPEEFDDEVWDMTISEIVDYVESLI